jgi:hypothetical protein
MHVTHSNKQALYAIKSNEEKAEHDVEMSNNYTYRIHEQVVRPMWRCQITTSTGSTNRW